MLNASKAYSTMATKHADVMPVIEFVTSPVDTFDPEDKYDFVHSCLWRDQFERDDGGTTGEPRKPSLESRLLRLCKPSGTLVTFVYVRKWIVWEMLGLHAPWAPGYGHFCPGL